MGAEKESREQGVGSEMQPPGAGRRTMDLRKREVVECFPVCEGWDGERASKRA